MTTKPLLVGEVNPYGSDPYYALYPAPDGCSGERLCRLVMGLDRADYLRRFDRTNLCDGAWLLKTARRKAANLIEESAKLCRPIVLLGRKVASAFSAPGTPPQSSLTVDHYCGAALISIPHPSGLCRKWSEPGVIERVRELLRNSGIDVPLVTQ